MGVFCRNFSLDIFKPQSLTEIEHIILYTLSNYMFYLEFDNFSETDSQNEEIWTNVWDCEGQIRGIRVKVTQQLTDLMYLYIVIVGRFFYFSLFIIFAFNHLNIFYDDVFFTYRQVLWPHGRRLINSIAETSLIQEWQRTPTKLNYANRWNTLEILEDRR